MSNVSGKTIAATCSEVGAALKISIPPAEVIAELKARLEKVLLKKGVAVQWNGKGNPELSIRIVRMDEGNRMLRYLLPFISPAIVEVEGQVAVGGAPREFNSVQRAQMGLFGGSAKGMLKVCAQGIAGKIAKDVLSGIKA